MSHFRKRDLSVSHEASSPDIDDSSITPPLSLAEPSDPVTTPLPLTRPYEPVKPLLRLPIRRSEEKQRQLQDKVSGEGELFCPEDAYLYTGPATAIPIAIHYVTTSYAYNGTGAFAMDVIISAIHQHMREYKRVPERLHATIEFGQQIRKDMKDLLQKDFDGSTIPCPYLNGPNIPIFFDGADCNCIVCVSSRRSLETKD